MSDSQEKWDFAKDSWQVGLDIYPLKSRIGEVKTLAGVVELADTIDLGSIAARRAGSSPVSGTGVNAEGCDVPHPSAFLAS